MATRGKQIIPTVDWHTPDVDPLQSWGAQTEASDKMRHSFNDGPDGPAFKQDADYIVAKQVLVKTELLPGVFVEKLVPFEAVVKGSQIVSPGGQVQTPYLRQDFGYIVAYYEALP